MKFSLYRLSTAIFNNNNSKQTVVVIILIIADMRTLFFNYSHCSARQSEAKPAKRL